MARKPAKPKTKKRNGSGSIYFEEARQKWVASIKATDGSRPKERFDTWEEADAWLTKTKNSFLEGSYVPADSITLGEWVLNWLITYKKPAVRPGTYIRYKQTAAHLTPIAGVKLQNITTGEIQEFLNNLPPMSSSSKNKIYKQLAGAFKKARSLNMIKIDPVLEVTYVKVEHKEIEVFTYFEIRKIIGKLTLPKTPKYFKKYYPLIMLAITTGMRDGEILGLKTKYLELNKSQLKVRNSLQDIENILTDCEPKTTASKRTLPLLHEVVELLRWQLSQRKVISIDGDDYVFQTFKGTPIWPKNLNRVWHKILEFCDVPYKNFHVLRHTYATELLATGVPLLEVSRKLGHSKASYTLDIYGHAIPGYTKEYADKLRLLIS